MYLGETVGPIFSQSYLEHINLSSFFPLDLVHLQGSWAYLGPQKAY